ncbi:hypothetical protein ABZS65_18270, partial [Micromonospora sp. NPDC005313]
VSTAQLEHDLAAAGGGLGPEQAELAAEWLTGWVGAAIEERPHLSGPSATYHKWRLAEAAAGRLGVVLHHADLLAG